MKCKLCNKEIDNDIILLSHFIEYHREELTELSSNRVIIEQIKLYYCDGV